MRVGYVAREKYGEIVDSRQERVYLKKTDETEKKKKEYLVPLDDHIEFEVTVSIKAKLRYDSDKIIEIPEEELSL